MKAVIKRDKTNNQLKMELHQYNMSESEYRHVKTVDLKDFMLHCPVCNKNVGINQDELVIKANAETFLQHWDYTEGKPFKTNQPLHHEKRLKHFKEKPTVLVGDASSENPGHWYVCSKSCDSTRKLMS